MNKQLMTPNYDIEAVRIDRMILHALRQKFAIMGSTDKATTLAQTLSLALVIYCGKPLYRLRAQLQDQERYHRFKHLILSRVARLRG